MDLGFEKHKYLDEVYEKAIKWLNKQGEWRGNAMKNIEIGMNTFNERSIKITKQDILNTEARREFHQKYADKQGILNMGENKYPDIKRGDNFEFQGDYYVFDRFDEGDGSHVFKNIYGQDKKVAGGPTSDFNKLDDNIIDIGIMDAYMDSSYELNSAKQYYEELVRAKGQDVADDFFRDTVNPLSEKVKLAREGLDVPLRRNNTTGKKHTENIKNLLDWESEVHGQMVVQGRWKKNTSNTSTSSSDIPDINLDDLINLQNDVEQFFNNNVNPPGPEPETTQRRRRRGNAGHRTHTAPSDPQPTGPQRGDQFYDPKRKRQYVYEGPDETFKGMHSFISDQGRTFVGNLDDLEKFTDESRFLNIDDLSEYRSAIDDLDTFLGDIRHGSKSMEDGFWDRAQKAVRRVNKAEGKVKKKIKYHRMESDSYKKKKVLQGYINDWKQKHTQQNTSQPETTQRRRRRGNVEHRSHTAPRTNKKPFKRGTSKYRVKGSMPEPIEYSGSMYMDWTPNEIRDHVIPIEGAEIEQLDVETLINRAPFRIDDPDLEDMNGGANDFDQGAYYEEDIPEQEWFSGHDDADNVPFGAEDFDDEFLANLTDDQILDQAQTNEELERYIKLRDDARARLGMDNQTFNTETENRTINNNFNGVNQERQQQQRNTQGNQEHKIDTDKPWTWTDDDIRTMADGDSDVAIDLMNQREQARQQQQQGQNQQRQTQEETKNTAEETTGDTSGSSNKETPKGNIDEETLKRRKIDRQQRSERIRRANKKLKGRTGEQLKNRSKGALRRGRAKGKYKGNKFKVKGGNLKQVVANTIVNEVVGEVAEEAVENILHPNMFNSLDQFADMSDDDIQHFADMIENEDLRKQRTKEWKDKRKQARNERKKQQKIDKQKELEDKINDLHEQYVNGEYKQEIPMHEKAKMNKIEFELDENGNTIIKKNKLLGGSADGDDIFGWMKKHNIGLGEAINVISTIGTYKDARKQGKGVVSSIASAAGTFVKGELLGFWGSLGWEAAKGIPKLAIKGAETLYKENRKMNSAANQQIFGGAQFQDTQQLATMRQSGMEMAKMAQYNLQQTLMGAEATHLHR